ncbi:UvrD-helicase domain-containing protein [Salinarimonas rosea]|uniref:UvrD-helicase domain-containing protein n=1 Tax=Salinarimonas rosea TaxID=552063 RepID=UPI0003FFF0B1|nr:UvrD-helicase domain-containing protein [Salinarimonas rosea]
MIFRIAETFTVALARLTADEQKAVKTAAFDLQTDPTRPGLSLHRIDAAKDPNFWSARASRDIRLVVHRTEGALLLAYVDHHDAAYAWAARRRIEAHPKTGAIQIVEIRERVEEIAPPRQHDLFQPEAPAPAPPPLFAALDPDALFGVGVPEDWIADIRAADEDGFFALAPHLPAEAAEALLEYAATGRLAAPAPVPAEAAGYAHPDARRRFVAVDSTEALEAALAAPWERWAVFLHPSQEAVVARDFAGPARVLGSAGTGKTVVALHRAARLASAPGDGRVLLATFAPALAKALAAKLDVLAGARPGIVPRTTVTTLAVLAEEYYELAEGRRPRVARPEQVREALVKAAERLGVEASERFLVSEWTHIVDAWRLPDAEAYATVPRLGRKARLGSRQRERLWPVFAEARAILARQALVTRAEVFAVATGWLAARAEKPFAHVIVDEAQDCGPPELRFLAALAGDGENALFLAGDIGQRIFQQPFSWKGLGIDVRGRSAPLKVCYRTSRQIRSTADRLLPDAVTDVDGLADARAGTVSVFEGPAPEVALLEDEAAEISAVAAFLRGAIAEGLEPGEVGVFVRDEAQLPRARAALAAADVPALELTAVGEEAGTRASLGVMHHAKGLEFKAVAVMACDDEVLPLAARLEAVADAVELEEVYVSERHLLYVACTRARDRLIVTGVEPGSEFLADMAARG